MVPNQSSRETMGQFIYFPRALRYSSKINKIWIESTHYKVGIFGKCVWILFLKNLFWSCFQNSFKLKATSPWFYFAIFYTKFEIQILISTTPQFVCFPHTTWGKIRKKYIQNMVKCFVPKLHSKQKFSKLNFAISLLSASVCDFQ